MQPLRTPGRDHELVAPARVGADGGPTRGAAGGPRWRRTSHGLYVASAVEATALQRTLEVGVTVPRHGAVTGWAALGWLGGRWSTGLESDGRTLRPIPVALSRHTMRPGPDVLLCEERYDPTETRAVDGIRITEAVRSVAFEMRYAAHLSAAVGVLDMAAYDDLVSVEEVGAWMHAHPSYTGIGQGRDAISLASENSWSPMESATRTTWVLDGGLPAPSCNRPLFDLVGNHLATPDLVDVEAGVVAEYDGGHHLVGSVRKRDRDRDETYRRHGIECVVVMEGDLREPDAVVRRLRAAYAVARTRSGPRTWTAERPSWWMDTSTVGLRRGLDEMERELWLRYRTAG